MWSAVALPIYLKVLVRSNQSGLSALTCLIDNEFHPQISLKPPPHSDACYKHLLKPLICISMIQCIAVMTQDWPVAELR